MTPRCTQPSDRPPGHPPGSRRLQTPHRRQSAPSCHNRHQTSRHSSSGSGACRAGWSLAPARWSQTGRGGHSQAPGLCCCGPCRPGTLPLRGREKQGTVIQSVDLLCTSFPGAGGRGRADTSFGHTERAFPSEMTDSAPQGPQASVVAQTVKNLPETWKTRVRSLGWEDPLEKGMATHSSILAWRIPWTEETGGLQSMGLQRAGHD